MLLDEHPVIQWVAVGALVAGVGGGAYSVVEIHKDMDTLISLMREIQDDQADAIISSDSRFQTRADEHRDLAQSINWIRGALSATSEHGHECTKN